MICHAPGIDMPEQYVEGVLHRKGDCEVGLQRARYDALRTCISSSFQYMTTTVVQPFDNGATYGTSICCFRNAHRVLL